MCRRVWRIRYRMNITQLSLHQFRNFSSLELDTNYPVNLFLGQNAQGKTNLLEAIYALSYTKSHRTSRDRELISWDASSCRIEGTIAQRQNTHTLQVEIGVQHKIVRMNTLEMQKLSHYIGSLKVVLFSPEQLELVKGSPAIRRKFLDREISQIYPNYLYDLTQYTHIVQQRNHYLRQHMHATSFDHTLLAIWNEQLTKHGTKVIMRRKQFIHHLQQLAMTIHEGLTDQRENLTLHYDASFPVHEDETETVISQRFMVQLEQMHAQERRRGMTLVGPHRDDVSFWINGKEAYTYGSQGQQRTTALSVKLAEIALIEEVTGETPILLLDDVLSELDSLRQSRLISLFQHKVQTFITSTDVEGLSFSLWRDIQPFRVTQGTISLE